LMSKARALMLLDSGRVMVHSGRPSGGNMR
jgi:hypothetical protein